MSTPADPQEPGRGPADGRAPEPSGIPPRPLMPPNLAAPSYPAQGGYPGGPQYPGQPYPPDAFGRGGPPKGRSRRGLWIGLGIAGGVVLLAIVGLVVLFSLIGNSVSRVQSAADQFNHHIIKGETSEAYEQFDPALKRNLSATRFANGVAGLRLTPDCALKYSDVSSKTVNGATQGSAAGTLDCPNGNVNFSYVFSGSEPPLMTSIQIRPQG